MAGRERRPASGRAVDPPGESRASNTPTIYDIARRVSVSPSTVSRALSRPDRVSAATVAAVRAAATELGFRPNPLARALPTGRSRTVALVVADITNPFIFDIARGAERVAREAGYQLIIAETQESEVTEEELIGRLEPSVDGVLLATSRLDDLTLSRLASRKPLTAINRVAADVPAVVADVATGVDELVDCLFGLGHRALVFLSGPETSWISRQRRDHILKRSSVLGVTVAVIGPTSPTIAGGTASLQAVLHSGATAAIAFNDLVAIGLMQAAARAGVLVPDHLSVAGFDDIFGSELIVPPLTTVRTPLQDLGERGLQSLLSRLERDVPPPDESPIPTSLIIRGSVFRPTSATRPSAD